MPSSSRYFPSDYHHGGYVAAFYCLSYAARTTQDSPAVWSGWDISLTAIIGIFAFRQQLDVPTSEGIYLISAGAVVLNLFVRKRLTKGTSLCALIISFARKVGTIRLPFVLF